MRTCLPIVGIATLVLQLGAYCSAIKPVLAEENNAVSRKRSQLNHASLPQQSSSGSSSISSRKFVQKGQVKNEITLRRKLKSDEEEEVVEEVASLSASMSMSMSMSLSTSMSMSMMSLSMSMPKSTSTSMCGFCSSNLVYPNLSIPTDLGDVTCLDLLAYALTIPTSDAACAEILTAEVLCCPPTIYDIGAANPDFSTLVSLVDAAGLSDVFKGEGPFTLFGK
jgi:hypothetical protein